MLPLAGLPADTRQRLHDAANIADEETLLKLAARMRVDHADDATELERLVRDFGFDEILRLTATGAT